MIAVILGHCIIPDLLTRIIFSWHMPLFFVISGLFFRDKTFKKLSVSKFKSCIKPYIITCVAMTLLGCIKAKYYHDSIFSAFIYWIKASLYGSGGEHLFNLPHIGALWFLLAMFWGILFFHFVLKFHYPIIPILILSGIGYYTRKFWLPLSIQAGLVSVLYIYFGYILRQLNLLGLILKLQVFPVIFSLWVYGLWKGCGRLYLVNNYFGMGIYDFIHSLIAVCLILNLSYFINKLGKIVQPIRYAGENSLLFLCFHILELNLFPWYTVVHGNHVYRKIFIFKLIYIYLASYSFEKVFFIRSLFSSK